MYRVFNVKGVQFHYNVIIITLDKKIQNSFSINQKVNFLSVSDF